MNISAQPKRHTLQASQPEFEAAIRKEFIEGSAIELELFDVAVQFAADIEVAGVGQEPREAIAEFLNWELKTTQAGFSKRESFFGALLRNEDGSPWQAKLSYQAWDSDKGRYAKPYKAPKGNGSRAYLPPVPQSTRNLVNAPLEGSFWDWVKASPDIPIILTEGAKKSLSALSAGTVAISLYGCNSGYKKLTDEIYTLISDLKQFCNPERTFILAFDRDSNRDTIRRVANAVQRMNDLLQSSGATVKIAIWEPERGKGIDDLIVSQGTQAWRQVVSDAVPLPKQGVWQCLESHNHQVGKWAEKEIPSKSKECSSLEIRSKFDPNVVFKGEIEKSGEDGKKVKLAKFQIFTPSCDFDFKVSKILSSEDGGGLMFRVSRVQRSEIVAKEVYIKSSELTQVKDFANALKRELGFNVSCILKPEQLQALIQNRTAKYEKYGGEIYRLADLTGQQDDGTWVFENAQFKADGTLTAEAESLWIFNRSLGKVEKIPSPIIEEQDPKALPELITACENFFHKDVMGHVLFVCGYATATLQRRAVMKAEHRFPQLTLFGERGGAKTTAARVAASIAGMHRDSFIISRFSESLIYEQVKSLGGLPFLIDDPIKKGAKKESRDAIDNFLWAMYNGTTRKVRTNEQTPHTAVIVSSNVALGEDNAATESRLIKLIFPVLPCNDSAYQRLESAMNLASGGFSQLATIQYDRDAVRTIESKLLEFLPSAHSRVAASLAMATYFTQKFVDAAGYQFDAFNYCKNQICPQMNQFESGKDSLTDFLEKLSLMRSEGLIGKWNAISITLREDGKKYLAVDLASVWNKFEQLHNPNYSRQGLNALIQAGGGHTNKKQKFVLTKLEWTEYLRSKAEFDRKTEHEQRESYAPVEPKRSQLRNCVLIPVALLPNQEDDSIDTHKPEESTATTEQADKRIEPINQPDSDGWSSNDSPVAPQEKTEFLPLPEGWQPREGERILALDFSNWKPATVRKVPGAKRDWKVQIEGVANPVHLYDLSSMRPLTEAAA
ncbi:MAG: DUF3854 domain-containing protein [Phormidium tanganyikae FI6-MK23]|jgi:hypothetical protein|nr:DUF3854 domain-containing protein [Phormidium tanganyikae FI6-MK23]